MGRVFKIKKMGILKIKLAQNYDYGPVNAAQNYLTKNQMVVLNLPKVKNWELMDSYDYSKGFGLAGQLPGAGAGWIGFSVCFLLNQTTGLYPVAEKVFNQQEIDGDITARQYEILTEGLNSQPVDSKMTSQVYLDSSKHMRAVMNKLNQSDNSNAQFVYEWDLGSVPSLETNTVRPTGGSRVPVGSGNSTVVTDGVGVVRPGWFGSSYVWEDGSATSFYSYATSLEAVENKSEIEEDLGASVDDCHGAQIKALDALRLEIEPSP